MSAQTVLITGTSRGIGLEAAKQFLSRGYTVISGVRSPEKQEDLAGTGEGKHLVVKLDVNDGTTITRAIDQLKNEYGIQQLNIVVSNAAIGVTAENAFMVRDAKSSKYTEAFHTNVIGTLDLFTAVYPLLPKDGTGKFIAISTLAALQSMEHWPLGGAYTTSKNALNYLVRQIHCEEKDLITFTISPGWVDTDMGYDGAKLLSATDGPPEKVAVTVPQLVSLIERGTREREGGRMINYDGTICDW